MDYAPVSTPATDQNTWTSGSTASRHVPSFGPPYCFPSLSFQTQKNSTIYNGLINEAFRGPAQPVSSIYFSFECLCFSCIQYGRQLHLRSRIQPGLGVGGGEGESNLGCSSTAVMRSGGGRGGGGGGKGEEGEPAWTPLSSWITPPSAPLMELSKSKSLDAVTMAAFPSILSSPPPQPLQPMANSEPACKFRILFRILFCIGESSQDKEFNSCTVWGTLRATYM